MNRRLMAAAALLAAAIGTPPAAFAQTSLPGLTRADVIADLVQAQRDGVMPAPKRDYPPSAQTIALNRARYAIAHGEQGAATANANASASVSTVSAQ
ncbi:DUF4148 domain-containing protein [Burkholderia stagnalis]|uniref:DUF4148 domain-containing protein n=1 Tax=Burkholderia stagnalis TaxID=1503054 RepID=A0ABX9YHE6_9BURK|nr:DUF4148 domain-containing protein [Burkholderia stagnalis]AOK57544.1 hypothetical protein WT74_27310 [Burkholderia stagnalis]KVN64802.1 hypothetical protein WT14_12285 [Burkholderia stagnalis]KVN69133.1 hypothetical protein WT15_03090 [Burkholderia stagnalis]KVO57241.1 hypothetical protein WT18_00295 [Burkholderia stagnalis]KVP08893.1 hypothetical protein WT20_21695 [Burkholderia stagnalis]